jgi:hypothetical protein
VGLLRSSVLLSTWQFVLLRENELIDFDRNLILDREKLEFSPGDDGSWVSELDGRNPAAKESGTVPMFCHSARRVRELYLQANINPA